MNLTRGRGKGQWWPARKLDGTPTANMYCPNCGDGVGLHEHTISADGNVVPSISTERDRAPDRRQRCTCGSFHDCVFLVGWKDFWAAITSPNKQGDPEQ